LALGNKLKSLMSDTASDLRQAEVASPPSDGGEARAGGSSVSGRQAAGPLTDQPTIITGRRRSPLRPRQIRRIAFWKAA